MSNVGALNAADDALIATLCDTAEFCGWCGAGSAADARDKVYPNGLPTPSAGSETYSESTLEGYRPYVELIADEENPLVFERVSDGTNISPQISGTIKSRFVRDITTPESGDNVSAARNMKREIARIVDATTTLWSGTDGHLRISRAVIEGPMFSPQDEDGTQGDYIGCDVTWHWGVGGGRE